MTPHRTGRAVALTLVAALSACAGTSHTVRRPERRTRAVVRPTTTTRPASTTTRRPVPTTTSTTAPAPTTTSTTRVSLSAAQAAALEIGLAPPRVNGVFALGDSVMLGAAPQLRARGIAVDAVESRQWGTGTTILARMAAAGTLPPTVVVHLGTNGPFSAAQFDATMRAIGPRKVVFVNAHEPRSWEQQVNLTLLAGVGRWPNARLVDWDGASTPHPEWFWQDDIHLRPQGAQAYAGLVAFAATH